MTSNKPKNVAGTKAKRAKYITTTLMVDGSVQRDVYHGLMVRRPFFVMPNQWYMYSS